MAAPSGRVYSDYDRAYERRPEVRQRHYARMKARRLAIKHWGRAAVAGKDIDHIKSLKAGGTTSLSNIRPRDIRANRADKTYH